jgi:hypothetical protein
MRLSTLLAPAALLAVLALPGGALAAHSPRPVVVGPANSAPVGAVAVGPASTAPIGAVAVGPAAPARPLVAVPAARRAADGRRVYDVALRRRATAVVVCELSPLVCTVAERRGARRWQARLPIGPASGAGEAFQVAVYAFDGPRSIRRELRGRFLGA